MQPSGGSSSGEGGAAERSAAAAAAYERGRAGWRAVEALPGVGAALAAFKTEVDTRPKGRLDLVSWVQYVCGFGGGGPGREVWRDLFCACCFAEHPDGGNGGDGGDGGEGGRGRGPGSIVLGLRVVEVAVLLAFSRCTVDEAAAGMTDHNLVKGRVRPAVEGRSCQARTPGILVAVQDAFDEFMYGSVGRGLLEAAKRDVQLGSAAEAGGGGLGDDGDGDSDAAEALTALATGGSGGGWGGGGRPTGGSSSSDRRDYALGVVQSLAVHAVREWEIVLRSWLRVALAPAGGGEEHLREEERRRVFLSHRADARMQLRDAFFRKLSVRLWRCEPGSYIGLAPPPRDGASGRFQHAPPPVPPVRYQEYRRYWHLPPAHTPLYSRLSFESAGQPDSSRSLRSVGVSTLDSSSAAGSSAAALASPGCHRISWDSLSTCSAAAPVPGMPLPSRRSPRGGSVDAALDAMRLFDTLRPAIYSVGVRRRMEILDALARDGAAVAEARFTVLELHAPGGALSTASLEFLPSDACDVFSRAEMHPASPAGAASASYDRTACFRLAGADSCHHGVTVAGARPSVRCRALQLVVEVVEVPAAFGEDEEDEEESAVGGYSGMGGRHRFRRIKAAEWVFLDGRPGREDDCEELERRDEILSDDWEDEIALHMSDGPRASGTARHLICGASMLCTTLDVADGVFEFPVRYHAPRRRRSGAGSGGSGGGGGGGSRLPAAAQLAVLGHAAQNAYNPGVWMEGATEDGGEGNGMEVEEYPGGSSASASVDSSEGMEELQRFVQVDCSTGARMLFNLSGGVERGTKPCVPERNVFETAPVWLHREV